MAYSKAIIKKQLDGHWSVEHANKEPYLFFFWKYRWYKHYIVDSAETAIKCANAFVVEIHYSQI